MREDIKIMLGDAVLQAKEAQKWGDFEISEIAVDYAKNEQFGDYTSNIAMVLAKKIGKNPMEIAESLKKELSSQAWELSSFFSAIEVAAPGYINFYLSKKYLQSVVEKISKKKENFGNSKMGAGAKVNNEFISANPTGPLHLGNGRGGFYGDALSNVLRKTGFAVTNEYYVNDAGAQVEKLGHSVLKDAEAVYAGEYIDELGKMFGGVGDVRKVGEKAAAEIMENIIKKTTGEKMKIVFDEWISEKKLHDDGFVDRAIDILKEKNLTYESEGALWLKTTEFGDDKDRVLIKENKEKTYFASDCGYILNKLERGFDRVIESWGADHHGYMARFSAAAKALGFSGDLKFIIVQLVRLVKDGKEAKMSKRAGNVVYLDDLIEEIGHDVTRFFFLMYSPDTHMNFDLGLAKERSAKNPVFYVQYAHARICSILAKAHPHLSRVRDILSLEGEEDKEEKLFEGEEEIHVPTSPLREKMSSRTDEGEAESLSLLTHEKEMSLIRELDKFPELIEEISKSYEVHKLPHFAMKLADKFHSFYDSCRVIDEADPELTKARLTLANAVRIVLAETLRLIGVSAPDKM